jgi:hypothetical protein
LRSLRPSHSSSYERRLTRVLRKSTSPAWALPSLVLMGGVIAAITAAVGDERAAIIALAVCQTLSVLWLGQLSWSKSRQWATVGNLVAAAWTLTFLAPSWIYAVSPGLLDVGPPTQALAIVELSLLCLIGGLALSPRSLSEPGPEYVRVRPTSLRPRILALWCALGLLALAVFFHSSGGFVHYLKNLDNEGSLSRGKTYFVILALAMLFAAQALVCARWSLSKRLRALHVVAIVLALGLVALLGARLFIAVPLVELALFYALVRHRPPLHYLAPALLVAVVVVIFGFGAVKRYSNYQSLHPGGHTTFSRYLRTAAVHELATAYANNYADGVRLIALGRATVPAYAEPEFGKEFFRLALTPIPYRWRPNVPTARAIKDAFYPSPSYAYAQPLQLVSYLQFSLPGVVVVFFLLGGIVTELDRQLAKRIVFRLSTLLALLGLAVDLNVFLRSASGQADAFAVLTLFLLWLVVRTSERPVARTD